MGLRRGDIVLAALKGDYGKPRPHLVVQTNYLNETHPSVVVCPITSDVRGYPYRVLVDADRRSGLRLPSEIMVDKLQAVDQGHVRQTIGDLDAAGMESVDRILVFLLGLGERRA